MFCSGSPPWKCCVLPCSCLLLLPAGLVGKAANGLANSTRGHANGVNGHASGTHLSPGNCRVQGLYPPAATAAYGLDWAACV